MLCSVLVRWSAAQLTCLFHFADDVFLPKDMQALGSVDMDETEREIGDISKVRVRPGRLRQQGFRGAVHVPPRALPSVWGRGRVSGPQPGHCAVPHPHPARAGLLALTATTPFPVGVELGSRRRRGSRLCSPTDLPPDLCVCWCWSRDRALLR